MKEINILALLIMVMLIPFTASCTDSERVKNAEQIEISELMASNRTGLQKGKGKKPADWIELHNTSKDTVDLEGFKLAVIKNRPDSIPEEEWEEEAVTWSFPSVRMGADDYLVVFADKKKKKNEGEDADEPEKPKKKEGGSEESKSLVADFNLPKEGATLQFLTPGGKVIKEVKYGALKPDQSLALQNDSTYIATYWQSPGFENTREGYEAAMINIENDRPDALKIWELMSRSDHSYENWVELKNTGDSEIDLSQYSLAKKTGKKAESWTLPSRVLQPGEIITIQLAGKQAKANNPLQANIKLGNAETIILLKNGKFIDGVCGKETPVGGSIGRMEGHKGFFFFPSPTKNAENGTAGKRFIAKPPQFDKSAGIYTNDKNLSLSLKDKGQIVHYTLDGSEPTASSPILGDTLLISKSSVVRTFAEGDSTSLRSKTSTNTFLLGVEHQMPVINVSLNKSDLYDHQNGIYVEGPGYSDKWPHLGSNYWKNWTKKAHVEFFDNKPESEGFSADCGIKIFGGFSRAEAKKSFRLKFRGKYGPRDVTYDFFDDGNPLELEDLVLRSGSQDYNRCMIRDEFFTSLMKDQSPALLTQKYRPVALYINAEYFGLYYIREKIDKNFVARQLNVPNDSITIIFSKGYREEGSSVPYKKLIQYISSHDMKNKENYEYVKENVDLQGLIDYKLGEIYSGNTDVGNIRFVRSTHPDSDKKWHFVFYDLDATWVGNKPSAAYHLATSGSAVPGGYVPLNIMINRLLANKEFREMFLERLSHHLTNTFSEKNTSKVFDDLIAQIRPEMERNCERWPQLSYEKWEKNLVDFKAKFKEKPKVVLDDIRSYLKVTDEENKKYFSHLGY